MSELEKKLEQLIDLIKAVKAMEPVKKDGPQLPTIPAIKPPAPPSMKAAPGKAPKIGSGAGPDSKKDPKKIAEQIKNGSMSTKTQKVMLKFEKNGQWSMAEEQTTPASI